MKKKPKTTGGRCAILARVSTEEQHLDAQVPALRAEAERRGLTVPHVVEDVGSGRKMNEREGLRRVLELVEARAIDVLLVAELTRVGRSVAGLASVVAKLTARGVTLISLRESVDLSTPAGRMFVHVLAAVAEFEVECLRERTSAGVAAAKARGRAVGQAPYGTRWRRSEEEDAPAVLEPVAHELQALRKAREVHAECGRWDETAARLSDLGMKTRWGRSWIAWKLARACRNPRALAFMGDAA
jgi:DNA invertase Pin-like site-specific DNA recombinase